MNIKTRIITGALALMALLSACPPANAQDEGFSPRSSWMLSTGFVRPSSPDAFSLTTYGSVDGCRLYTGAVGMSIPFYTYSDRDFSLPVSFSYSSDGYRPNVQSGVLGMGWTLCAGGCITREVRGIMDDAWPDLEMYMFRSKFHGSYGSDLANESVSVHGYGFLHDLSKVTEADINSYRLGDYEDDYVYQGRAGSEYLPVKHYRGPGSDLGTRVMFEEEPDVFHFSVPGHSGSFILQPDGGFVFYDTSGPSRGYSLSVELEREGFRSFTITDDLGYVYTFDEVDRCTSSSTAGIDSDLSTPSCWQLTRITAPNGRHVEYTYGAENVSQYITPAVTREISDVETQAAHQDREDVSTDHLTYSDYSYLVRNRTVSRCLSQISVYSRVGIPACRISFSYSAKAVERGGLSEPSLKLDGITVQDGDLNVVRSCSLSYVMDGRNHYNASSRGLTFLHSVSIPGEGMHVMEYVGRNTADFPYMDTYETDWYGYWNPSVDEWSFAPTLEEARNGRHTQPWLTGIRQPSPSHAMCGMLESVTWPTGGTTEFSYEANVYGEDWSGLGVDSGTGPGVRIASVTSRGKDGTVLQRKDYAYIQDDGRTSSGRLLWRPCVYSRYDFFSTGVYRGRREVVSSMDDAPFSGKTVVEYPRVLETTYVPGGSPSERGIVEYLFRPSLGGDGSDYYAMTGGDIETSDFSYGVSSDMITHLMYTLNHRTIPSMAGRLEARNEYAGSLSCPVTGEERVYTELIPDYALRGGMLTLRTMTFGHESTLYRDATSPALSAVTSHTYGSPDHSQQVSSTRTSISRDDLWRTESVTTCDASGSHSVEKVYTYDGRLPGLVTSELVLRDGRVVSGRKCDYVAPFPSRALMLVPGTTWRASVDPDTGSVSWLSVTGCSSFDDSGNPLAVTDALGHVTRYTWDGYGNPLTETCYAGTPTGPGITTHWTWKPLVGMSSETSPGGRQRLYEYDQAGRLVRVSDGAGNTLSSHEYVIDPDIDSHSWTRTSTYRTASEHFDDITYHDGLGYAEQSVSVGAGGSGEDVVTLHAYDALMRPSRQWLPYSRPGSGGYYVDGAFDEMREWYLARYTELEDELPDDILDRIVRPFSVDVREFSPSGRTIASILPGTSYDSHPSTVEYVSGSVDGVDVMGVRTTDGDGRVSVEWTDFEGRTVAIDRLVDGTVARTMYRYDWKGNLSEVVTPEGNVYSYVHDGLSRVVSKTIPGRDADTFTYDALDRVSTSQDGLQRAGGVTVRYAYDSAGHLTSRSVESMGLEMPIATYTYSPATGLKTGEQVYALSPDGWVYDDCLSRSFTYDSEERVTRVREDEYFGEYSLITSYTYDLQGNALTITERVEKNSGVMTVLTSRGYDERGRLTSETVSVDGMQKSTTSITYDELGRPCVKRYGTGPDAIEETTSYTVQGWVEGVVGDLVDHHYCYDESSSPSWTGNMTVWGWQHHAVPDEDTEFGRREEQLSYDGLGRLSGSSMRLGFRDAGNRWSERGITYDLDGNLLHLERYQDDGSTPVNILDFTYDGVHRAGFGYDANGNVTNDPLRGFEMSYNLLNLASEVRWRASGTPSTDPTPLAEAMYYADGTRAGVMDPESGYWTARYIGSLIYYGESGEESLDGIQTGDGYIDCSGGVGNAEMQYFLRDHLGSVRVVASDRNTVLRRSDYLPFGVRMEMDDLQQGVGRSGFFGFSGKENEMWPSPYGSTGVVSSPVQSIPHWELGERYQHFGARAYDPLTCTFLQTDPLAEKYYGVSPYAFCAGNPVMFVDPDGRVVGRIVGAIVASSVDFAAQVAAGMVEKGEFSWNSFTAAVKNVDYVDVAMSGMEGFVTMGASAAKKTVAKGVTIAVSSVFNCSIADGGSISDSSKAITDGVVGCLTDGIGKGISVRLPKQTANQAVSSARAASHAEGKGFTAEQAKSVASKTRESNAAKNAVEKGVKHGTEGGMGKFIGSLLK